MRKVVILGAGRLGSVMGKILHKNNNVELWDKVLGLVDNQKQLKEIIPKADFIFLCLPSWVLRSALQEIKPLLSFKTIIVSMSKGIEKQTLKTIDEVLAEELPKDQRFVFIGGPMMAEEIAKGLGGVGVAATEDRSVFKELDDLFEGPHIYLEHSLDLKSIVFAGVLKNIYSVGLGIASGLEWGGNFKGWLLVQSIREMQEIMKILARDPKAILTLAGIGDIITTGFSSYSANYRAGKFILENGVKNAQSEATNSFNALLEIIGENNINLPFLNVLKCILVDNEDAKEIFDAFRPDNL